MYYYRLKMDILFLRLLWKGNERPKWGHKAKKKLKIENAMVVQLIILSQKMRLIIGRFSRKNETDNFFEPIRIMYRNGSPKFQNINCGWNMHEFTEIWRSICKRILKYFNYYWIFHLEEKSYYTVFVIIRCIFELWLNCQHLSLIWPYKFRIAGFDWPKYL